MADCCHLGSTSDGTAGTTPQGSFLNSRFGHYAIVPEEYPGTNAGATPPPTEEIALWGWERVGEPVASGHHARVTGLRPSRRLRRLPLRWEAAAPLAHSHLDCRSTPNGCLDPPPSAPKSLPRADPRAAAGLLFLEDVGGQIGPSPACRPPSTKCIPDGGRVVFHIISPVDSQNKPCWGIRRFPR